MCAATDHAQGVCHYELRFEALFNQGRGYAFPCDAEGQVDLALLSEKARANYLRARASVGREFSMPVKRNLSPLELL